MSEVKRHWLESYVDNFYMAREFVLASDYDSLQGDREQQYDMKVKAREQRDKMCAENKRLREALKKAATAMWSSEANMDNEAADIEEILADCKENPNA